MFNPRYMYSVKRCSAAKSITHNCFRGNELVWEVSSLLTLSIICAINQVFVQLTLVRNTSSQDDSIVSSCLFFSLTQFHWCKILTSDWLLSPLQVWSHRCVGDNLWGRGQTQGCSWAMRQRRGRNEKFGLSQVLHLCYFVLLFPLYNCFIFTFLFSFPPFSCCTTLSCVLVYCCCGCFVCKCVCVYH